MFNRIKKIVGLKKEKEYEQNYPKEVHDALKNITNTMGDYFPLDKPHFSHEYIKKMENENPTHWIWKYVNDPIELNYRHSALQNSMIGRYDICIDLCETGLKKYPNSPYFLYMLGRTLGDLGNYESALNVLNHTIQLFPDFADVLIERGSIKANMGYFEEGLIDFKSAKTIEPTIMLPNFSVECALCNEKITQNTEFSFIFPGIIKGSFDLTPPRVICKNCADLKYSNNEDENIDVTSKMVIALNEGNYLEAFEKLKSIFNKENDSHWYNAGNILYNLDKENEALQCYDKAIFLNTHYIKAWYRKACLLFIRQDYNSAVKAFDNVISLDPDNMASWGHAALLNSMLCCVFLHNSAISGGKGTKELSEITRKKIEYTQKILDNKRIKRDDGSYQRIIPDSLNINDFVDYCYENRNELLDLLEDHTKVVIKSY